MDGEDEEEDVDIDVDVDEEEGEGEEEDDEEEGEGKRELDGGTGGGGATRLSGEVMVSVLVACCVLLLNLVSSACLFFFQFIWRRAKVRSTQPEKLQGGFFLGMVLQSRYPQISGVQQLLKECFRMFSCLI